MSSLAQRLATPRAALVLAAALTVLVGVGALLLGFLWWWVPLSFAVTIALVAAVAWRAAGVAMPRAILGGVVVALLYHVANLSLWPYVGFLLFPVEVALGAWLLRRVTAMRWRPALVAAAVARAVSAAMLMPSYFADLFT